MRFVSSLTAVPAGLSKDELMEFHYMAGRDYPSLLPVIEAYLRLSDRSETGVPATKARRGVKDRSEAMHLFDLLREKKLFPSNSDLSEFAGRVLPNMSRRRFDKMSRGDIAARIIEYLETRNKRTRERLESSMREAMRSPATQRGDRKSFFSQWEKIIKGIEL